MPQDYLGRYQGALRRLQSLERGGPLSPVAPQAQGAFDVGAPAPQNQGPAFEQAQPGGMFNKPMNFRDVYREMPDEAKDDLEKQVTAGGQSVDQLYQQGLDSGEIEAPEKPPKTTRDKLGYIAEVALRTISNMSRRGTSSLSDWADAELTTQQRRGALEAQETERQRQGAEVRRLEGRADAKEQRTRVDRRQEIGDTNRRADEKELRDRAARDAELGTQHQNALELEALRSKNNRSERQPQYLTGEDGGVFQMDGDTAKPVTTKRSVTTEQRGPWKEGLSKRTTRIVEEQLKALPRAGQGPALDPDTIMRSVGDRIKQLKEDRKLLRELKAKGLSGTALDDEIAKRATEQVMSESARISGQAPAQPAAPKRPNAFDAFD